MPHALNMRLYLSWVWSLTFTEARCLALCRAPTAFSARNRRDTEVPPRWHRDQGRRKRKEKRRFSWPGMEVWLEELGDGWAAWPSETSRWHTWVTAAGHRCGESSRRMCTGLPPAQAPAGDVSSAKKAPNLPHPDPKSNLIGVTSPWLLSASPMMGRDQNRVFHTPGEC